MGMSLEDLAASEAFGGSRGRRPEVTFLPEPEPRDRWATIISVDDHVVEPPDAFADRFPAKYRDDAPRVVDTEDGGEAWSWCGELLPNVGFNAVAGRPSSEYGFEPTRFDEMRRGAWDVRARLADMDLNGVWGSLCFPSFLPGFVGQRLTTWPEDEGLALAAMRAYNDWHLEAWCGSAPDRFIPTQIAWLRDPELAADEIRRNAARGFRALTFSEAPEKLGLPSLHTGHWDPMLAACEETEHRGVPARRLVGHVADDRARRATRDRGRALLRVRHVRGGRLAVLEDPGAVPRSQDLPLRGRHRVGGRSDRPARPLLQVPARVPADVARRGAHAERGAQAQLLVLRDRRHVGLPDPRRDRRGEPARRERLPARRLDLARHAVTPARAARRDPGRPKCGASAGRTRSSSSGCRRHPTPSRDRRRDRRSRDALGRRRAERGPRPVRARLRGSALAHVARVPRTRG